MQLTAAPKGPWPTGTVVATVLVAVSNIVVVLSPKFGTYANGAAPTIFTSIKIIAAETMVIL